MTVLLSLNVPPEKVATYSGLAESLVSFGDLVFLPLVSLIHTRRRRRLISSISNSYNGSPIDTSLSPPSSSAAQ
jgi:hypothetical protein